MESYQSERSINLRYFCVKLSKYWLLVFCAAIVSAASLATWRFLTLKTTYQKELQLFEQGVKDSVEPAPVKFPVSYIIVGLLLGIVIVAFVIFVREFLNGKLKCSAELNKPRDAQLLAVFKCSKDTKVETYFKKLVHYEIANPIEEEMELLYSRLKATCRNQGIPHLVFAGDVTKDEVKLLQDAVKKLQIDGIPAEFIGNILTEPMAILKLQAEDGIVLAVKAGQTSYKTIDEEISQCKRQNTKLIGFVAFD